MRAREWKRLIEEERDRMRAEAEERNLDGERYLDVARTHARILLQSADALDRVLKAAEGDQEEDEEEPAPVPADPDLF